MSKEKLYKNLKLSERIILFLKKERGCTDYPSRNKYEMLTCKTKSGEDKYYFIGKNGAVRVNRKPIVLDSISLTDRYHKLLKLYETTNNLI